MGTPCVETSRLLSVWHVFICKERIEDMLKDRQRHGLGIGCACQVSGDRVHTLSELGITLGDDMLGIRLCNLAFLDMRFNEGMAFEFEVCEWIVF